MVASPRTLSAGRRFARALAATIRVVGKIVSGLIASVFLIGLAAGVPVALVHFVGWPLPDHIPTWDELQLTMRSPMSPRFVLDVLTCLAWPVWACFVADVLAAIPDAARSAPWRHSLHELRRAPLHTVAGALVGGIVFSIVTSRTSAPAMAAQATATESSGGAHTIVATAPYHPETAPADESTREPIVTAALHTHASTPSPPGTETVREPEQGVYDSLWRVAQRRLGDGKRWPEIWKLNHGTTQIDGTVFSTPNLIQPG